MKTPLLHYSLVSLHGLSGIHIVGLLDMLRYDNARVVQVSTSYCIIASENPPTVARWMSFGIAVEGTEKGGTDTAYTLAAKLRPAVHI